MRELERQVILAVLDRKWREHLYEMDYLREGIGLRGYGQRDPLVEYQREGYRHVRRHDGGHQGRVRRQHVQPAGPGSGEPDRRGGGRGRRCGPRRPRSRRACGLVVPAQGTPPSNGGAHARNGADDGQNGRLAQGRTQRGQRAANGGRTQGARAGGAGGAHARPGAAEQAPAPLPAGLAPRRAQQLQYSAPSLDGDSAVETSQGPAVNDEFARVGRNDPCPCGSGRKFKRCHGDPRMRADA